MIRPDHPLQRLMKSTRRVVFEPMLGEYVYAVDEVSNLTAKTPAERKAEERQRRAESGLVRLELYAHPGDIDAIKELAAKLQRKREKKPK